MCIGVCYKERRKVNMMSIVSFSAEDEAPTCENCIHSCPLPNRGCSSSPPSPWPAWPPPGHSSYAIRHQHHSVPDIFLSLEVGSNSKARIESLLIHLTRTVSPSVQYSLQLANTVHHSPDAETHSGGANQPHRGSRHTDGKISLGTSDNLTASPSATLQWDIRLSVANPEQTPWVKEQTSRINRFYSL